MGLTSALDIARVSLSNVGIRSNLVSQNILGASDPNYSRRNYAAQSAPSGITLGTIDRASNDILSARHSQAQSDAGAARALDILVQQMQGLVGEPGDARSLGEKISQFKADLIELSAAPADRVLASQVFASARDLVTTLNTSYRQAMELENSADRQIRQTAKDVEALLAEFETADQNVIRSGQNARQVHAWQDKRDELLSALSEKIGIRSINRADGGVSLFTDGNVVLYETVVRPVVVIETPTVAGNATHAQIVIDGVAVLQPGTKQQSSSGELAGFAEFRDQILPSFLSQLDEIATNLVQVFADVDQSNPPVGPSLPGLFTYGGAPAMPATGANLGIAGTIQLAAQAKADNAGMQLLRDGGFGAPASPLYNRNQNGVAGFSDWLGEQADSLETIRMFDPSSALAGSQSLEEFAVASTAWVNALSSRMSIDQDKSQARLTQISQSMQNEIGVSLDEEMANLLEVEQAYQASAKLIATLGSMFATLVQIVE